MAEEIKDRVLTRDSIDDILGLSTSPKPFVSFIAEITGAKDSGLARSYNLRVGGVELSFQYRPEEYNEALSTLCIGSLLYIDKVRLYRGKPLPRCYDSSKTVVFTYRDANSYYKFDKQPGRPLLGASDSEYRALRIAFQSFKDREGAIDSRPASTARSDVGPLASSPTLENAQRSLLSGQTKPPFVIENIILKVVKQVGIHTIPTKRGLTVKAVFQVNDGSLTEDCLLTAWVSPEVYETRRKFTVGMRYQFDTLSLKLYKGNLDAAIDTCTYMNASEHYVGGPNEATSAPGDFKPSDALIDLSTTAEDATGGQASLERRISASGPCQSSAKRIKLASLSPEPDTQPIEAAAMPDAAKNPVDETDGESAVRATQLNYADASQNFD